MRFDLADIFFQYQSNSDFSLNAITFSFNSTEVLGLAGANGSGKTTLIHILLHQLVDYTGNYSIDTHTITDTAANLCWQYGIGYAPADPILDETLTGYEILRIIAQLHNLSEEQFTSELQLVSNFLQISDWVKTQPCRQYSSGMRKKVSIAIAFMGKRQFVILDEPLNGLDPVAVYGVQKLISFKKQSGIGALVSSHILDFIEKGADTVLLLKNGRMIYFGSLKKLYTLHPGCKLDEIYFSLYAAV